MINTYGILVKNQIETLFLDHVKTVSYQSNLLCIAINSKVEDTKGLFVSRTLRQVPAIKKCKRILMTVQQPIKIES